MAALSLSVPSPTSLLNLLIFSPDLWLVPEYASHLAFLFLLLCFCGFFLLLFVLSKLSSNYNAYQMPISFTKRFLLSSDGGGVGVCVFVCVSFTSPNPHTILPLWHLNHNCNCYSLPLYC